MGAILAACKRRGMLTFSNFNRIHLVPPLTTTIEEAREGLQILDEALTEVAQAGRDLAVGPLIGSVERAGR